VHILQQQDGLSMKKIDLNRKSFKTFQAAKGLFFKLEARSVLLYFDSYIPAKC